MIGRRQPFFHDEAVRFGQAVRRQAVRDRCPGNARNRVHTPKKVVENATTRAASGYRDRGGTTDAVTSRSARNPTSTRSRRIKLFVSRTAPTVSVSASAISAATRALRTRRVPGLL